MRLAGMHGWNDRWIQPAGRLEGAPVVVLRLCALAQPAFLVKEPEGQGDGDEHQAEGEGVAVVPVDFGEPALEVHPVDAGDQRRRQHRDRSHREDLDDLVLVDVDETDGGVHQEVDLAEEE